uniref:Saposin B-type domain-containing protein n=1 Tax=Strongyloides venezuelensis TaxID=75913 RepID=A0A0K0FKU8_STRVS
MKLNFVVIFSFTFLTISQTVLADSGDILSCAACVVGVGSVINSIKNNPKTMAELGSEMSESCDSLPSKRNRAGCREIFNNHMNELFDSFVNQPEVSPDVLCKQIQYC